MKRILIAALALATLLGVGAENLTLKHANSLDEGWGNATVYTPYVAFSSGLLAPYVGAKVTKVRFALAKDATNVRLYVNHNPKDDDHLLSVKLGDLASGWHEVALEEPVEVDGSNLSFGYKATFSESNGVAVSKTGEQGVSFIYVNGTDQWINCTDVICIEAILEGDKLPENELRVVSMPSRLAEYEAKTTNFPLKVRNAGLHDVTSFTIQAIVDGGEPVIQTFECRLSPNDYYTAEVAVPSETPGVFDVVVKIVDTNAKPDAYEGNNEVQATMTVRDPEFKRMLVLEEGTALWCTNCPRGIVGLEKMKEKYPNEVFPVSIHASDELAVPDTYEHTYLPLAYKMPGYPSVYVNRRQRGDPYYDIEAMIYSGRMTDSPMKFSFEASWNEDGTAIDIVSTMIPRLDLKASEFNVAYALVEDGITGYAQSNGYAGGTAGEFEGWENKSDPTTDVVFNDIARGIFPSVNGMQYSEDDMIAGDEIEGHYILTLPVYPLQDDGMPVGYAIKDTSKLRVIGMILNNSTLTLETGFGTEIKGYAGLGSALDTADVKLKWTGESLVTNLPVIGCLSVYAADGREIMTMMLQSGSQKVALDLISGIYIARLSYGFGTKTLKIVI